MTSDYEKETGIPFQMKAKRGRPKVAGSLKDWDIRLTPSDQQEVDFSALEMEDFKILLVCKEGQPNGQPRLHYHMWIQTERSDNYLDNILNKLGKATAQIKGNAIFSKRKAHEGTQGYVVKGGQVVVRHGISDTFITELFARSLAYKKDKERERKKESRSNEKFLGEIMSRPEVKRLATPQDLTAYILTAYSNVGKRFPPRSTIESVVMTMLFRHSQDQVIGYYTPRIFSQY